MQQDTSPDLSKLRIDPQNEVTWENRDRIEVVELDGLCMPHLAH